MSLKTRRRKIGSQPSAKRVDRRRRAAAKFFQVWAGGWFDRKSLLDQLRKCDQPVSGEAITSNALFPQHMKTASPE